MGDPRHISAKSTGPGHPWQKERIEEEKGTIREFGLKNKRELWKSQTQLKSFTAQAKNLIAAIGPQADKEKHQLMTRLNRLGLITSGAKVDDGLGLQLNDLLKRRLQTQVSHKGLARTITQARQFITHSHVMVGGKTVTSPSYLVSINEESTITFKPTTTLANTQHPERIPIQRKPRAPRPIKRDFRRDKRRRQ